MDKILGIPSGKPQSRLSRLIDKIMGDDVSLEHLIFLCGALAGTLLSAFGAIGNFTMNLHPISVLVPLVNFIVDVLCIAYSIVTKKWRGAAVCIFTLASFVLFPFLWFTTGGTLSSSLPLVIGLGVVLIIVFRGPTRGFFFFSVLLLYSALIAFEMFYPDNFVPYPTRNSLYIDVLIGFVLSFLASGGLAYFTLVHYNESKAKTELLVQQLETISITDPLTRVFNRRHLMVRIDEEMRKSFENNDPLSLCILDIDHFKHINDTYGHLYGDEVLIKIAETISACLSKNEIFGRYGGEEFVILFLHSDLQATLNTANNFLDALRCLEWPHGTPITISGGISMYTKGLSYSKFLELADANLYKAKANGRNRVEH